MARISFRFGPRRTGIRGGRIALFLFGLSLGSATRAQDVQYIVSPAPELESAEDANLRAYLSSAPLKPDPPHPMVAPALKPAQTVVPEKRHPLYWLDRRAILAGAVLGGSEIFDGVTTRYFIHHCSHCSEDDPASRLLLGAHPTWGGMIPAGIAEVVASTYTYEKLSHSPHRFLRSAAPLVPLGLIGVHLIEGARNIGLKNKYYCADPGYIVVGPACVPAPPRTFSDNPPNRGPLGDKKQQNSTPSLLR